jgi:FecR protein
MKAHFLMKGRLPLLVGLAGLLLFTAPNAKADDDQAADPPSRVARISYLDGSVSFQPTGTEDWSAAAKNRPVTIGDKIWSDKDSRVELQAGEATFHIGSMTAFSFLNLDENITQARVAEGAVNFRVRELREGDLYEIDTPNLAFTVKEAGAFRVDVDESGENTRITVIRGEGEVTSGGQTYDIRPGDQAEFNGAENPEYHVEKASAPDDLDRWAADRDLKEENSASAKYVSRDVPGYDDLDDYGSWREEPDYGPVWYPSTVAVGWAPYSWGYWNWVGPWGWTWVGYEPWGFAPFHYGRWAFVGGAWGWCPGPLFARPFYGPAFVGFIGGGHFGFGFGFGGGFGGGIGWFPLGFREPFHPWYHASFGYLHNVNIRNTRITNVNVLNSGHNFNYAYAHNAGAVSVASRSAFVSGHALNRSNMHVTSASLRGAQVTNGAGFRPERTSFTGVANARAHVSTPPAAVQGRSVVARTAPASAAAAAHIPVRTMSASGLGSARAGLNGANRGNVPANRGANGNFGARGTASANGNSGMAARGRTDRPPSANTGVNGRAGVNSSSDRPSSSRAWSAQGNATDRGRAPQGAGRSAADRPSQSAPSPRTQSAPSARTQSDRPVWARSGANSESRGSYAGANRPSYSNQGRASEPPARSYGNSRASSYSPSNRGSSNGYGSARSYSPPSRSYSAPSRAYSAPSRAYSAPSRSYSAPSRSYSAPSRSYSAPSRSYGGGGRGYSGGGGGYSGGGGGSRGGGGGASHGGGGGGGSRGGGGGGSHGGGSHGGGSHGRA